MSREMRAREEKSGPSRTAQPEPAGARADDERRKLVLSKLAEMGLQVLVKPTGAFYVFFNVSRYTDDVLTFAFEILENAGLAITPGVDFGPHGEGFLRLSYANSLENLEEGLDRLARFLGERSPVR